ncbi:MAG TPA: hypothetical protein VGS21_01490 [Acidimicrobiales bacterium]|nr:hypothetical protein [Acidimicrobiales bacterium]
MSPQPREPRDVLSPPVEGTVVDWKKNATPGYRRRKSRLLEERVRSGEAKDRPVILWIHIRGTSAKFPRHWRWAKLVIDAGPLGWTPMRLVGDRPRVPFPKETTVRGMPRRLARNELSFSSPNPRKTLVIVLDTAQGELLLCVRKFEVDVVMAALDRGLYTARRKRSGLRAVDKVVSDH